MKTIKILMMKLTTTLIVSKIIKILRMQGDYPQLNLFLMMIYHLAIENLYSECSEITQMISIL